MTNGIYAYTFGGWHVKALSMLQCRCSFMLDVDPGRVETLDED